MTANLKELDRDARRRIRKLAEVALEARRSAESTAQRLIDLRIEHQAKEAAYEQAKLAREIAEIAVAGYTEGTAKKEAMDAKVEISLAEAALDQSREDLHDLKTIIEKAKKLEPKTVDELMSVYKVELALKAAQISQQDQKRDLEQAKGRLTILELYITPTRTRELKSEVEKARANELSLKQTVVLASDELNALSRKAELNKNASATELTTILQKLEEAVGIEVELRSMLKNGSPDGLQNPADWNAKMRDRLVRLGAVLDDVEERWDDLAFKQLGQSIQKAAPEVRADASPGRFGPLLERLRKLSSEDQQAFRNGSREQRMELLKKAGFTDAELKQMFKPRSPQGEKQ